MNKPSLKKIPHELTVHGHTRVDNYYWLNERESPEVLEYLKAENAYQEEMMKHTEPLQNQLFKEITGRIKQNDMSVPVKHHGYWYYTRYEEGMVQIGNNHKFVKMTKKNFAKTLDKPALL